VISPSVRLGASALSRRPLRPMVSQSLWLAFAAFAGLVIAYLVANGLWYVAVGLLLAVPGFVVLHRYPLATISVWLLLTPLVVETSNETLRKVFWLVHRGLPLLTLLVLAVSAVAGLTAIRRPRLGWPELLMGGYLVATAVSIAYTSSTAIANAILLYDRVAAPMCLYLIVRLLEPTERDLRWLVPAMIFVLISQSVIGLVSWTAPALLPADWSSHVGERTTGSLRTPDLFGTTVLFCGTLLFHAALESRSRLARVCGALVLVLTMFMVFMTFSRANWLAGLLTIGGILYIHRRFAARFLIFLAPILLIALSGGMLAGQTQFAQERFLSEQAEESALSRLPVVVAAFRMFEERPLVGWGYENFDRFDRQFQSQVGDLYSPVKDHASHNTYLTILAEQGIVGFLLFVGPIAYWLVRSMSRSLILPMSGFLDRRLLATLWFVLLAYVVVNNFSRMLVPFGLGMWWMTLGLIASIVHRYSTKRPPSPGQNVGDLVGSTVS